MTEDGFNRLPLDDNSKENVLRARKTLFSRELVEAFGLDQAQGET